MNSRRMINNGRRIGWVALPLLAAACVPMVPQQPAPRPAPATIAELPPISVQTIVGDSAPTKLSDQRGHRITLNVANGDLRDLLPLLASEAGVNLVLGPEVVGRVSVRFQNVLAIDALRAVIEQAGLLVGSPAMIAPWGKAVWYDLPVNVNTASATTIAARFDVSPKLAEWLVKTRKY